MVATFCLLTCALIPAQPADRSDWLLTPRLSRGQELVYSGTFTEEILGAGVQFNRSYRLDSSVFILETGGRGASVAFLTVLELRNQPTARGPAGPPPCSVRLEVAQVNPQGRVEGNGAATLLVPLEGPPTAECGAFVEVPASRVGRDHYWEVTEAGRPPRTWRVLGMETINNTSCLKLLGQQQSDDWDQPRADRTAWRRRDTVWMTPGAGIASRVERVLERREPARQHPTQRTVVRYDLVSRLIYPGKLYQDRQREIAQANRFANDAAPYLRQPAQYQAQLDALLKRIDYYLENRPPIEPYRKAVLQVKRRALAARRGEAATTPVTEETTTAPPRARLGYRAPDFVATDLIHDGSVRLYRQLGQPILLVFYNPASQTAAEVLRFAGSQHRLGVTVLGMAVSDDVEGVRRQHADLRLAFPVLAGKGFKASYGVDATPRLVILDAQGIVRGGYTGWGSETPSEVSHELKRWLHP
jgi:peroxiredoxin